MRHRFCSQGAPRQTEENLTGINLQAGTVSQEKQRCVSWELWRISIISIKGQDSQTQMLSRVSNKWRTHLNGTVTTKL